MPDREGLMAGKRGLVMGVANERSIAWGIARAAHAQGAELAFTFQGEALEKRVRPLARSVKSDLIVPCDVADDDSIDGVFEAVEERWGKLDFLVHAIAYADKEGVKGKYVDTSRDNFVKSLDISCYSFTALARRAVPLMPWLLAAVRRPCIWLCSCSVSAPETTSWFRRSRSSRRRTR